MDKVKVIKIQKSIYANNDEAAKIIRKDMIESNTFLVNLMSSPGSGKTTTLLQTIKEVGDKYRLGILEADIDSDVDAQKIAKTGVKAIQLHTGGMCHLDAKLTKQGLDEIGVENQESAVKFLAAMDYGVQIKTWVYESDYCWRSYRKKGF